MKIRNRKEYGRTRRHRRVRKRVQGTPERPRLTVFRSAKHIYAQIIDDVNGRTLANVASLKIGSAGKDDKTTVKIAQATEVGKRIAEAARKAGVTKVAFDRGGYLYHGRVAALAKGAREGGLEF